MKQRQRLRPVQQVISHWGRLVKIRSEKAIVQSEDDGQLFELDIIEHEDQLWLVPHWYDVPALGVTKPARIIRLKSLESVGARQPGTIEVDFLPAGNQFAELFGVPVGSF